MSKKSTPRTALANILDNISNISPLEGGEIIASEIDNNFQQSPSLGMPMFQVPHGTLNNQGETLLSVDPFKVKNWNFHDRPSNELGDIDALAHEFKTVGQQQPCIVRLCVSDPNFMYEVIAGERRWRAAKAANVELKVIVKDLDDKAAATCQASENSQRKDLSDYAKGISFHTLIEQGLLTREDIQQQFGKSKSYVRNLLSFARMPSEIINAIGDLSKLSATTAYEITRMLDKGESYYNILMEIAPTLSGKNISDKKLQTLVEKRIHNATRVDAALEVKSRDGRHLFTWRNDTNGNRSIAFPKDIRDTINFADLEMTIIGNIEKQLKHKNS